MNSKVMNKKLKLMFPEHRDLMSTLKQEDPHFAKLLLDHDQLDREISHLEIDPLNHIHEDIELLKRKKLRLKDRLYLILQKNVQINP
ncbi:YdcH family protein [Acinetobacter sp. ULE_I010]|uniref:YdcH family protein n=1 Tax=Acinetobacter sp. ULE_I010 TaxID=3373065 RepID=UPI003AF6148F